MSVVGDYAFIPSDWRGPANAPTDGVPTSYFAAVQLRCTAEIVDDAAAKAELLTEQLEHFQPDGGCTVPTVGGAHSRLLPGIRGLRLHIVAVSVKFKYGDHKPADLQLSINNQLLARDAAGDAGAALQQKRRFTAKH